jgi:hypothetical protein
MNSSRVCLNDNNNNNIICGGTPLSHQNVQFTRDTPIPCTLPESVNRTTSVIRTGSDIQTESENTGYVYFADTGQHWITYMMRHYLTIPDLWACQFVSKNGLGYLARQELPKEITKRGSLNGMEIPVDAVRQRVFAYTELVRMFGQDIHTKFVEWFLRQNKCEVRAMDIPSIIRSGNTSLMDRMDVLFPHLDIGAAMRIDSTSITAAIQSGSVDMIRWIDSRLKTYGWEENMMNRLVGMPHRGATQERVIAYDMGRASPYLTIEMSGQDIVGLSWRQDVCQYNFKKHGSTSRINNLNNNDDDSNSDNTFTRFFYILSGAQYPQNHGILDHMSFDEIRQMRSEVESLTPGLGRAKPQMFGILLNPHGGQNTPTGVTTNESYSTVNQLYSGGTDADDRLENTTQPPTPLSYGFRTVPNPCPESAFRADSGFPVTRDEEPNLKCDEWYKVIHLYLMEKYIDLGMEEEVIGLMKDWEWMYETAAVDLLGSVNRGISITMPVTERISTWLQVYALWHDPRRDVDSRVRLICALGTGQDSEKDTNSLHHTILYENHILRYLVATRDVEMVASLYGGIEKLFQKVCTSISSTYKTHKDNTASFAWIDINSGILWCQCVAADILTEYSEGRVESKLQNHPYVLHPFGKHVGSTLNHPGVSRSDCRSTVNALVKFLWNEIPSLVGMADSPRKLLSSTSNERSHILLYPLFYTQIVFDSILCLMTKGPTDSVVSESVGNVTRWFLAKEVELIEQSQVYNTVLGDDGKMIGSNHLFPKHSIECDSVKCDEECPYRNLMLRHVYNTLESITPQRVHYRRFLMNLVEILTEVSPIWLRSWQCTELYWFYHHLASDCLAWPTTDALHEHSDWDHFINYIKNSATIDITHTAMRAGERGTVRDAFWADWGVMTPQSDTFQNKYSAHSRVRTRYPDIEKQMQTLTVNDTVKRAITDDFLYWVTGVRFEHYAKRSKE